MAQYEAPVLYNKGNKQYKGSKWTSIRDVELEQAICCGLGNSSAQLRVMLALTSPAAGKWKVSTKWLCDYTGLKQQSYDLARKALEQKGWITCVPRKSITINYDAIWRDYHYQMDKLEAVDDNTPSNNTTLYDTHNTTLCENVSLENGSHNTTLYGSNNTTLCEPHNTNVYIIKEQKEIKKEKNPSENEGMVMLKETRETKYKREVEDVNKWFSSESEKLFSAFGDVAAASSSPKYEALRVERWKRVEELKKRYGVA